jgi:hypothetical protein
MPQPDQPDRVQVENLNHIVSDIIAVPADQILRTDLNLVYLHRLQQLYGILAQVGIGFLPPAQMGQLTRSANEVMNLLRRLQEVDRVEGLRASQVRSDLPGQTQQMYEQQFPLLGSCIGVFQVQAGGLEKFKRAAVETQEQVDGIKTQCQGTLSELAAAITAGKTELNNSIDFAKQAAEIGALSSYATYFDGEARSHKHAAWGWLSATSALFAATVGLAYWFWSQFEHTLGQIPPLSTAQSVQLTIAKVAILSTIFTVAVASGRVYRSHRHNYVINQHRRNALRTFQAFVNAPEADAQTKNAVLLEATRCIFSQQPTGYIASEQENSPSQILEIVRQLNPRS